MCHSCTPPSHARYVPFFFGIFYLASCYHPIISHWEGFIWTGNLVVFRPGGSFVFNRPHLPLSGWLGPARVHLRLIQPTLQDLRGAFRDLDAHSRKGAGVAALDRCAERGRLRGNGLALSIPLSLSFSLSLSCCLPLSIYLSLNQTINTVFNPAETVSVVSSALVVFLGSWMRILERVPASQLWIVALNEGASAETVSLSQSLSVSFSMSLFLSLYTYIYVYIYIYIYIYICIYIYIYTYVCLFSTVCASHESLKTLQPLSLSSSLTPFTTTPTCTVLPI